MSIYFGRDRQPLQIGTDKYFENKYAQAITNAFSEFLKTAKRKPNLLETDDGKEYVNKFFNEFLEKNKIKSNSRYIAKGALFVERFNGPKCNLLKKLVFAKVNGDWITELPSLK